MNDERRLRRKGPFAPLSATYAEDRAVVEAGEAAELLFVRGLAWSKRPDVRSDGFISDAQLAHIGAGLRNLPARARRLSEVGLWVRDDALGGWHIRRWLDWNRSSAEIDEHRARDARRKRETREQPP